MSKSVRQKDEWGGTLIEENKDDWGGTLVGEGEKKNPIGNDLKNGTPPISPSSSKSTSTGNNFNQLPMADFGLDKSKSTVLPQPVEPKTDKAQKSDSKFAFNPDANVLVKKKPSISIYGTPVSLNIPIPLDNQEEELFAKELQQRIDDGTYNSEDVNTVAKSMDKSPLAAAAYMKGKTSTGNIIHFNDVKQKEKETLEKSLLKANSELGLADNFDAVFSTPESAGAYLQKIEKLYTDKTNREAQKVTKNLNDQAQTPSTSSALSGMPYRAQMGAIDEVAAINSNAANEIKNIISNDIIDKVSSDENLTKDQKVRKIYSLTDSRDKKNVESAITKRLSSFQVMDLAFGTGDNTNAVDLLNSNKAGIEFKLNRSIKEKIDYNNEALNSIYEGEEGIGSLPEDKQKMVTRIEANNAKLTKEYVADKVLFEKYPVLFKGALVNSVNDFNAIKSGNVKGYQDGNYANVSLEEHLKNNGFDVNDQKVKDFLKGDNFKDYSFFGRPVKNITDVFVNTAKSVGDVTGFRDEADVLSEKKQAEIFPTQVGAKDDYQLTDGVFGAKTWQNIGNTTGQVIGQGLLQAGTAGLGRMAGLSKLAATNAAFWTSGSMGSYDQAYKDSFDFIDSKVGRTAYAGLIALSNAASEKLFPEIKLFQIPGIKDDIARISREIGSANFSQEAATELLSKAKNKIVDYALKYADNIGKETAEEVGTSLFESANRYLFGDPTMNMEKAMDDAKETAIQTAVGTSLIGGFGVYKDLQSERNVSAKSTIYNAAIYHDEALDAINKGFTEKKYNAAERDAAIQTLNTAKNAVASMEATENITGNKLSRPNKELYAANLTVEALLTEKSKNTTDDLAKKIIDEKISNLKSQRQQILNGEVEIDEDGNITVPKTKSKEDGKGKETNEAQGRQEGLLNPEGKTVAGDNPASVIFSKKEQDAIDGFKGQEFVGSMKNWTDVIQSETSTPEEKKQALQELKEQLSDPNSEIATGEALGKSADLIYGIIDAEKAAPAQKQKGAPEEISKPVELSLELLTASEKKEWNDLSMAEKLKRAKENLPEVQGMSDTEIAKIADKRAKELLPKVVAPEVKLNVAQDNKENADLVREIIDENKDSITLSEKDNIQKAINEYEDGVITGQQLKDEVLKNGVDEKYLSESLVSKLADGKAVEPSTVKSEEVKGKTFIHETNADTFDKFDLNKAGTGQGDNWLGKGVYLQEEGTFKIEKYGKNKVVTKLNPKAKIFETKDTPNGKYRDTFVEWAVENTEIGARKAKERLDDGLSLNNLLPRDILKQNKEAVEKLREQGYDGLYMDGELVVYNPDVLEIQKSKNKPIQSEPTETTTAAVSESVQRNESVSENQGTENNVQGNTESVGQGDAKPVTPVQPKPSRKRPVIAERKPIGAFVNKQQNDTENTGQQFSEQDNDKQESVIQSIESVAENTEGATDAQLAEAEQQAVGLINLTTAVTNVPLSEISTNTDEYQGRKNAFSERSAKNVAKNFDANKFDPIVVYKHPNGKTYVLSGHSRLEGMRRRNAVSIPARYFNGTPEQAAEFAQNSNKFGTVQTDIENAAYYRTKLNAGASYNALMEEAKENEQAGSVKRIVSLAYLNPKGKVMQALSSLESGEGDTKNNIMAIAAKIGDIRAKNDHLTNAHENELFEYMLSDSENIPTDKQINDPANNLNRSISTAKFSLGEPLNLERAVYKSQARIDWEAERDELTSAVADLKKQVNPNQKTGWNLLKEKAIATLARGDKSKSAIDKATTDFENNKNGIKDAYQKQVDTKRLELTAMSDKLAKHLLREKSLIEGDKAQTSLFSAKDTRTAEQILKGELSDKEAAELEKYSNIGEMFLRFMNGVKNIPVAVAKIFNRVLNTIKDTAKFTALATIAITSLNSVNANNAPTSFEKKLGDKLTKDSLVKEYGERMVGRWSDYKMLDKKTASGKTFRQVFQAIADEYGLPVEVLFASTAEEGLRDFVANPFDTKDKAFPVSGFENFGLDNFASMFPNLVKEGYLENDFPFKPSNERNEKNEVVKSANFKTVEDAIRAKAAILTYVDSKVVAFADKNNIELSQDAQDFFMLIGYNAGLGNATKMLSDYSKAGVLKNDSFLYEFPSKGNSQVRLTKDSWSQPYEYAMRRVIPAEAWREKGVFGKANTALFSSKDGEFAEVINGFYSPIEDKLIKEKSANLSATKWLERLGKGDEMTYTGLRQFLESKKPNEQVKKSEIQSYLRDNRIEISEVVKSDVGEVLFDDGSEMPNGNTEYKEQSGRFTIVEKNGKFYTYDRGQPDNNYPTLERAKRYVELIRQDKPSTKFATYQLPGEKTNYKEVLITLPNKKQTLGLSVSQGTNGKFFVVDSSGEPVGGMYNSKSEAQAEVDKKQTADKPLFKSSHFDEDNIVVHLRMNERFDADGKKILFIEEVQSDWQQLARKQGVRNEVEINRISELAYLFLKDRMKNQEGTAERLEYERLIAKNSTKGVADAPFINDTNSTTKLALKVALQHAVNSGMESIAWTTGEQQNDRYDLSKQVDSISYSENKDGTYYFSASKNGYDVIELTKATLQDIENNAGKDIAIKVKDGVGAAETIQSISYSEEGLSAFSSWVKGQYNGEYTTDQIIKDWQSRGMLFTEYLKSRPSKIIKLKGDNLKVGGKGMIGFYGSPSKNELGIVGKVAESLFGKGSVKTTSIDTGNDAITAIRYDGNQDISVIPGFDYIEEGDWLIKDVSGAYLWSEQGDLSKEQAISAFKADSDDSGNSIQEGKGVQTQFSVDITPEMKAQVQGGLPLFSNKQDVADFVSENKNPVTVEKLQAKYPSATIVKTQSELPVAILKQARAQGVKQIEGVLHNGTVYMVAENLENMGRAEGVFRHETIGHAGVIAELKGKLNNFAASLVENATGLQQKQVERLSQRLMGRSANDLNAVEKSLLGQEYIAQAAEKSENYPTTWEKVAAFVRSVLRDLGIKISVSERDIKVLLARAAKQTEVDIKPTRFSGSNIKSVNDRSETPVNIDSIGEGFVLHRGSESDAPNGFNSLDKVSAENYAGDKGKVISSSIKQDAKVLKLVSGTTDNYNDNKADIDEFYKIIGEKERTKGSDWADGEIPSDITTRLWDNPSAIAKLKKAGIDIVIGNTIDGPDAFIVNQDAVEKVPNALFSSKDDWQSRMQEMLNKVRDQQNNPEEMGSIEDYADDMIDWIKEQNKDATANDVIAELEKDKGDEFTEEEAPGLYDYVRKQFGEEVVDENEAAGKKKLTEVENEVMNNLLNKPITAQEYPTFFDMNRQLQQIAARTQSDGQDRVALDGSYVEAHLEDMRSISLVGSKILTQALGKKWKSKFVQYLEENPNAGNVAQVAGLLNVVSADVMNEIKRSRSGSKISELKDLQARVDRLAYDNSRSASLALNQRRLYQNFSIGKPITDILAEVILTPDQLNAKQAVEEALRQKYSDEELNNTQPKSKKGRQTLLPHQNPIL